MTAAKPGWRTCRSLLLAAGFGALALCASGCTGQSSSQSSVDAAFATASATSAPAATAIATASPTITAASQPTATSEPISTPTPPPSPTATAEPEPAPRPTAVPTAEPTPTSTPVPTAEATATAQPTATAEPQPATLGDLIGAERVPDLCLMGSGGSQDVPLRSAPTPDSWVSIVLPASQCGIEQLGPTVNGWTPIQAMVYSYLRSGFIEDGLLAGGPAYSTPPFQSNLVTPESCVVNIVAPDVLNLRIGPSVDSPILDTLAPGQCRIFPTGQADPTGRWIQVSVDRTSLGGWVAASFIESTLIDYVPQGSGPDQTVVFDVLDFITGEALTGSSHRIRLTLPGGAIPGTDGVQRQWFLGTIDGVSAFTLPAEIDPTQVVVTAYRPQDPFCASNGTPEPVGDGRYRVASATLCV